MKVLWPKYVFTQEYMHGTRAERRFIELKLSLAKVLRARRRELGLTQKQLAHRLGADQATISRLERAKSARITIDLYVWALFVLDTSDVDVAAAFHLGVSGVAGAMRGRATLRLFPRAADIRHNARNHHHRRRAAARPDDRYECCVSKRAAGRGRTARAAPHDRR
ncbi:MAG: helix-turn-helix domain-containing protein [Gemmatimonadota bacterium]